MVDPDLILAKAASVKNHLKRVKKKHPDVFDAFIEDMDCQDIVLFNLQMAIQNCIDIAAHIVSDEGFGVPGSTNEMFYLLEENGYLNRKMTEKMVQAVGFRNLIVHEYGKIDLKRVYDIAGVNSNDLIEYLASIFHKSGISDHDHSVNPVLS